MEPSAKLQLMHAGVLHGLGESAHYEEFRFLSQPLAVAKTIVNVRAAALKPEDKQLASGSHYASPKQLPAV